MCAVAVWGSIQCSGPWQGYMQVSSRRKRPSSTALWPLWWLQSGDATRQEVREAMCACTYVGRLFLRQLQLLLGIFKSLGVFVQFIFGALEFLLQRHQLIFQLGVGRGGWGVGVQQAA